MLLKDSLVNLTQPEERNSDLDPVSRKLLKWNVEGKKNEKEMNRTIKNMGNFPTCKI
jgi:hypothetical protein